MLDHYLELSFQLQKGNFIMSKQNQQPENDFPPKLASPARRALAGAGYSRLEQLTHVTEAELLQLHGMGPNAIKLLREALEAKGMAFKA